MTQNFKAIVIDNQNEKFSRAIKDLKTSDFGLLLISLSIIIILVISLIDT